MAARVLMPTDQWTRDDTVSHCVGCHTEFSFFTRKHHCRLCGKIYCGPCSSQTVDVPGTGAVRSCNACLNSSHVTIPPPPVNTGSLTSSRSTAGPGPTTPTAAPVTPPVRPTTTDSRHLHHEESEEEAAARIKAAAAASTAVAASASPAAAARPRTVTPPVVATRAAAASVVTADTRARASAMAPAPTVVPAAKSTALPADESSDFVSALNSAASGASLIASIASTVSNASIKTGGDGVTTAAAAVGAVNQLTQRKASQASKPDAATTTAVESDEEAKKKAAAAAAAAKPKTLKQKVIDGVIGLVGAVLGLFGYLCLILAVALVCQFVYDITVDEQKMPGEPIRGDQRIEGWPRPEFKDCYSCLAVNNNRDEQPHYRNLWCWGANDPSIYPEEASPNPPPRCWDATRTEGDSKAQVIEWNGITRRCPYQSTSTYSCGYYERFTRVKGPSNSILRWTLTPFIDYIVVPSVWLFIHGCFVFLGFFGGAVGAVFPLLAIEGAKQPNGENRIDQAIGQPAADMIRRVLPYPSSLLTLYLGACYMLQKAPWRVGLWLDFRGTSGDSDAFEWTLVRFIEAIIIIAGSMGIAYAARINMFPTSAETAETRRLQAEADAKKSGGAKLMGSLLSGAVKLNAFADKHKNEIAAVSSAAKIAESAASIATSVKDANRKSN